VKPCSVDTARRQAEHIVRRAMRGMRPATRKQRVRRVGQLAEILWSRWQVGIRSWQHKHVLWVLDVHFGAATPHTRYQMWLAVRDAVRVLRRSHWEQMLQGPWVRPTGQKGPLGLGRRAKVTMSRCNQPARTARTSG
jgi:hypothetical protein